MHGGGASLASRYLESDYYPDLILATDMLDLPLFLALTRSRTSRIPVAMYFHENQLTYPWSPTDRDVLNQRDHHYAFINIASAAVSDACLFNSRYHMDSFINAIPGFLNRFPDEKNEFPGIDIHNKASVLPLGLDLRRLDKGKIDRMNPAPVILWNHRWEYDKNPESFFRILFNMAEAGLDFSLIILGENFSTSPAIFTQAKEKLSSRILHFGYVASREEYARFLWMSDLLPVTSKQEFFGASVMEAVYCGVEPLLPDRLTYPDLFPESCIYRNESELEQRLIDRVSEFTGAEKQDYRRIAAQYDWSRIGPVYDTRFEEIVLSKESVKRN